MSNVSAVPPAIRTYVQGFVTRGNRLSLLRGAGMAAAVSLGFMLLSCGLDRLLQLHWLARFTLLAAGSAAALALLGRPIFQRLRCQTDWVTIAERIEARNPHLEQRLVTVISRLLGQPEHRGSDQMLEHLVFELDQQVAGKSAAGLLPLRPFIAPWVAVSIFLVLIIITLSLPGMGFPALVHRFVSPLADLPPVTTTQVRATPGHRDVAQSTSLQIDAEVDRLNGANVWLMTSEDNGHNWSRLAMNPTADGHYLFTLAAVDRDFRYYVSAGDAQTPQYDVRVLRPPAISEFHIHYIYPAYTGRPPANVTNTDGVIEAPVGTEVVLTAVATEPLQSALLTVAGDKSLMTQTGADNTRQKRFVVLKDGRYNLDLISTRDQTGTGPATMSIRAIADQPPIVRFFPPARLLCLQPRDSLPLAYDAADDYGLESLALRVSNGTRPAIEIPLDLESDARSDGAALRHREGRVELNLAALDAQVGDAIGFTIFSRDSAGNTGLSARLEVLIAPHTIDHESYDLTSELDAAVQAVELLRGELDHSLAAAEENSTPGRALQATRASQARLNRGLAGAAEAASIARRALLRAITHCASPQLCETLAALIDEAQQQASTAETLFGAARASAATLRTSPEQLRPLLEMAARLHADLQRIAAGEHAALMLRARDNLAAIEALPISADTKASSARARTLQRLREEVSISAKSLGIDPSDSGVAVQIQKRVDGSQTLQRSLPYVDFVAAARAWGALNEEARRTAALDERLSSAAQAIAVRPDVDWPQARDLQLAARAAAAIQLGDASRAGTPAAIEDFVVALTTIRNQNLIGTRDGRTTTHPTTENADATASAIKVIDDARQTLGRLAATAEGFSPAKTKSGRLELLAFQANAEAAGREYASIVDLDRALVRLAVPANPPATNPATTRPSSLSDPERLRLALQTARTLVEKLDALFEQQAKLIDDVKVAESNPKSALPALAVRQRDLAGQIAAVAGSLHATSVRAYSAVPAELIMDRSSPRRAATLAKSAAAALAASPVDFVAATTLQSQTRITLAEARQAALRQAASERLALVPSFRPILQSVRPGDFTATATPGLPRSGVAAAREWKRSRSREADVAAGPRETDPSEYEPALRAYFDALGKAREAARQ